MVDLEKLRPPVVKGSVRKKNYRLIRHQLRLLLNHKTIINSTGMHIYKDNHKDKVLIGWDRQIHVIITRFPDGKRLIRYRKNTPHLDLIRKFDTKGDGIFVPFVRALPSERWDLGNPTSIIRANYAHSQNSTASSNRLRYQDIEQIINTSVRPQYGDGFTVSTTLFNPITTYQSSTWADIGEDDE